MSEDKTSEASVQDAPSFEQSLSELEELVTRLECGEVSLEESLRDFERGTELACALRERLDAAQQRVEKVMQKEGGKIQTQPVDLDDEDDVTI